jgi:hypothetical protein
MRFLVLLALISPTVVFAQPQTTKIAKIEEIFRLTKVDQMQKQISAQMLAMMKQQTGNDLGAPVAEFVMKKMSWDTMKADYIKLYDDTYTEDEISGILMFYQSAPGQAMLTKSPALMTNTMALVQKRMAEIKPELEELIKKSMAK